MPIPFLLIGGIAVVCSTAGFFAYKKTDLFRTKQKINLAVLGLKGSGKTTLQNYLRNDNKRGSTPLSMVNAPEVIIVRGKKIIIIKEGFDVSGNDESIRHQYEELVKENDHIIFTVDSSKLQNNDEYAKENRGLLNKINKILEQTKDNKKVLLLGSHKDQLNQEIDFDDAKLLNYFNGINNSISQTFLVNLTSQKDLKNLKKSLFA